MASYKAMRYRPEHRAEIHRKIVKDAAQRVRAEGLTGAAVSAVMRDAGLTHGGFYKHFRSKDELVVESLREAFREIADRLAQVGEQARPGTAWKAIVKAYLSPEHCDHAEWGCPLAALAPELARTDKRMKAQILGELARYKSRMLPFMPGRRAADKERAFEVIISTMLGAIAIARILPDQATRARVLASTRDFLLKSF
ncbi:MAG TPA: TetR/AcrR family transcriptional regulator [Candidatus Acidoferrum sp.]|nr:TetR/AcrR family transcriptional regulator [Candidatus Acidoferrum sp.]